MVNQFIHLKTKSHYSILESSIKVDDLIDSAVEYKMPAIALTDTNNLFGAMEFTKKAQAATGIGHFKQAIQTLKTYIMLVKLK